MDGTVGQSAEAREDDDNRPTQFPGHVLTRNEDPDTQPGKLSVLMLLAEGLNP